MLVIAMVVDNGGNLTEYLKRVKHVGLLSFDTPTYCYEYIQLISLRHTGKFFNATCAAILFPKGVQYSNVFYAATSSRVSKYIRNHLYTAISIKVVIDNCTT